MKLIVTNDGETATVELVEDAADAEVCEGCGRNVFTYAITADDETWRMAECLPCLLKTADEIRPAPEPQCRTGRPLRVPADDRTCEGFGPGPEEGR